MTRQRELGVLPQVSKWREIVTPRHYCQTAWLSLLEEKIAQRRCKQPNFTTRRPALGLRPAILSSPISFIPLRYSRLAKSWYRAVILRFVKFTILAVTRGWQRRR